MVNSFQPVVFLQYSVSCLQRYHLVQMSVLFHRLFHRVHAFGNCAIGRFEEVCIPFYMVWKNCPMSRLLNLISFEIFVSFQHLSQIAEICHSTNMCHFGRRASLLYSLRARSPLDKFFWTFCCFVFAAYRLLGHHKIYRQTEDSCLLQALRFVASFLSFYMVVNRSPLLNTGLPSYSGISCNLFLTNCMSRALKAQRLEANI